MRKIWLAAVSVAVSVSSLGQSVSYRPFDKVSENRSEVVLASKHPSEFEPQHARTGIASDWTHHHVVFPAAGNPAAIARAQQDPRWMQSWYLHHREAWWPRRSRVRRIGAQLGHRDWSVPLGTAAYEPFFDYSFDIDSTDVGSGSLNAIDELSATTFPDTYLATGGTLTMTGGPDAGSYTLANSSTAFTFDNILSPTTNPPIDGTGILFSGSGLQIGIEGTGANTYSYADFNGTSFGNQLTSVAGTFTVNTDPGGGQTYPAKYVFDVNAAPDCTRDYVTIGIPAIPSNSQANIVGYNGLYSGTTGGTGLCGTGGPSTMFAYESGTGEVPGSITLSLDGSELAYVENLLTGSSYFHVLTIGTTGSNGTSATSPAVPGTGNNATDVRVLLSPDGSITQSSTSSPFITYFTATGPNAYVTTYSWASGGSGYLYKLTNVFGGGTPAIAWSVQIPDAVPSDPIYDGVSNTVFFTDSKGRIDWVLDSGTPPTLNEGPVFASGTTSLNPVTIDSVNEYVYATFNSNGTHEVLVQVPVGNVTTGAAVSDSVGLANLNYTGPYGIDFNNNFFTGSASTWAVFINGTDEATGTVPSLWTWEINHTPAGKLETVGQGGRLGSPIPLSDGSGPADATAPTEFFNPNQNAGFGGTEYIVQGVTNHCAISVNGIGCIYGYQEFNGNANSQYLDAPGGTTGIIVDNDDNTDGQTSNFYYGTKMGPSLSPTSPSLVKVTQNGFN